MAGLQPVRGTHDLLPDVQRRHRHVTETAREIAERFGYQEIATPIFEFTEVFSRTLGDASDVVTKEMYTFADRGGEQVTLRPEATAGVARAVISGGLRQHLPLKFFCSGPMFRYERPQKGRQRQFHQIDMELLGVAEPRGDVEIIAAGADILDALGVLGDTKLELNTLGDTASRTAYREALVDYFQGHRDDLSDDSKMRLERNPLRILDSKDEGDRRLITNAPAFDAYLNAESNDFFAALRADLDRLEIAYECNQRLVRGLDYYCHTAFEFVTDRLGAQGTVMAGGRYDGLFALMGGPDTPGVGWAAGIERLAMLCADPPAPRRPVAIVPIGDIAAEKAVVIGRDLRRDGFSVDVGFSGNLSKRMKRANRLNASAALIIGDDELELGVAGLRDLDSGDQRQVPLDRLAEHLAAYR